MRIYRNLIDFSLEGVGLETLAVQPFQRHQACHVHLHDGHAWHAFPATLSHVRGTSLGIRLDPLGVLEQRQLMACTFSRSDLWRRQTVLRHRDKPWWELRQLLRTAMNGYQVQAYLNHDGQFDGFAGALQAETMARIRTPVTSQETPVALKAFDGTPIAGDYTTLAAWQTALSSSAPPQALYYNTVTLHDGNRVPGAPAMGMMDSYRQRLANLLRDMDRFIGDIERSRRPTLVVLMPEHGAALRKGAQHIAGLRDTPWPEITQVPVAVKLIGMDAQRPAGLERPIHVSRPTSYLSFAALLADLLAQPEPWPVLKAAPDHVPGVDWISDNGETLITRDEQATWLRTASSGWQRLARPEFHATPIDRGAP